MQKLGHNNFHVGLDTQPARTPGLVLASWSQEVKLGREFEESSSIASGYGAHLSVDAFVPRPAERGFSGTQTYQLYPHAFWDNMWPGTDRL